MAVKERKEVFLIARITKFDKSIIEQFAKDKGISISAVVREMIQLFSLKNGG